MRLWICDFDFEEVLWYAVDFFEALGMWLAACAGEAGRHAPLFRGVLLEVLLRLG